MESDWLRCGERLDDLLIGNLKIIQNEQEFCFSLDAVLLAHFATVRPGVTAVDLGAGTGVLGLLLLARGAGSVTGVEINPALADMAGRSAGFNGLAERLHFICADIRQINTYFCGGREELVIANPPYRPVGGGLISPNGRVAVARHEVIGDLAAFIAAARFLVKYRGRFAMVHLPERLAEILKGMSEAGLEPKRLQLVYPRPGRKPKLVLVEGVRGGKPGLDVLPPLFVCGSDGGYSQEIQAYYQQNPPQAGDRNVR
ncbi:MAG: methyltransferase [Negativicutes bacterium]|nr:methyltransferase [Negativicutes bacterium]